MQYTLILNNQQCAIDSILQLTCQLETVSQCEFIEIWLNEINGAALCVLVNRDKAFLMFLRAEGDSGFTSRDPDYSGSADSQIEFLLANGQRDEYSAQWCVSITEAIKAVYYFFESGQKSPLIFWHQD